MLNENKGKRHWSIMGVLVFVLIAIVILFTQNMQSLNQATNDLSNIQYLNSSTQRCVRMVLSDKTDNQLVYQIGNQTKMLLDMGSDSKISVLEHAEYVPYAIEISKYWDNIFALIGEEEPDKDIIEIAIDSHFDAMTTLSSFIDLRIYELNQTISNLQYIALFVILLLTSIMSINILQSNATVRQNKELSVLAAIDTATGLFNRSKCQELFKTTTKHSDKEFAAVIVIDLNDLKKTNDLQGHRVGDELIFNFAKLLKSSCEVHQVKPFVGRYGGDEFVIYYKHLTGDGDIKLLLKELDYLSVEFNKNESRFNISYAIGYAMNTKHDDDLSVRELFDIADENMYINKQAMKREKAEQEARGEVTTYTTPNITQAELQQN